MKKLLTCLLIFAAVAVSAQRDFRVRFLGHTEIFPENFSKILTEKHAADPAEICGGYFFRYLQFAEIPSAADRREMESVGVRFLDYYSFGCYLAGFPAGFDFSKLKKFEPRSLVAGRTDWKISQKLMERPLAEWAVVGNDVLLVMQVFPTISISEAAVECRRLGIEVVFEGSQNGILQVRVRQSDIEKTAALPFVKWLERIAPPSQPEDTGGRSIHRSNLLDSDSPMGRKYNGHEVAVLCRDDGQVGPHIDFHGRIHNLANLRPGETHGDGVSGIMCGAGNLDPTQKGMAAGAELFVIDYVNHFQDNTMELHLDENVLVTNSSYSDGCNDGYTTTTQTVDRQTFENPTLMHVFSAGNSNGSDCDYGAGNQWGNITGGHKMGKNVIATANLFADGVLATSSSRGPAHDGRLKPDIAAHGQEQGSTSENQEYQAFGGTSGAAPGIAGCLAQLQQAHRELEGGDAPAALLKATLLATANDMGRPGPDFKFGWGHVNAHRAVQVLEKKNWVRGSLGQGASYPFLLEIPANVRQARVMVYWADRQSAINAAVALINDLDFYHENQANGTKTLPLVLDPTPDPLKLDAPAKPGEDHLNNVEQVRLDNPAAGQHLFVVRGTEVPFGPQEFYIVWDFLTDAVELTYPSGGEGLVPGEPVRLHWDASDGTGNFDISFAADGSDFKNITTVAADLRMWVWEVPQGIVSSKAKLRIERGGSVFTMSQPFSIVGRPRDLEVVRVCPDSISVKYKPVSDTLPTDIYILGQKYMEIVSSKIGEEQTFYFKNDGKEKWLSARTSHPNGLTGRRMLAVRYPGGLNNCPQDFDGSLADVLEPAVAAIVRCDAFDQTVKIRINNDGLQPMEGAKASYQVDNQQIETENLPDIPAGGSLDFEFSKKIPVAGSGINLKIWVSQVGDVNPFNDTIAQFLPIVTQPASGLYSMNFQNLSAFPPLGWVIDNPDKAITWQQGNATGTTGGNTSGTYLNCYSYPARGAEDALYMIPVDLSPVQKPGLAFSLAHAPLANNFVEKLRIEVFEDCDLTKTPVKIYEKSGSVLATTAFQNTNFFPNEASDWRTEVIDLKQFKGKTVIIRFVGTNDNGNNIWLDNVRILEYDIVPADASFVLPADSVCRATDVIFTQNSTGTFLTYAWNFGAQATPFNAAGPGPHTVSWITPGKKNVRLIVSNPLGSDTMTQSLIVRNTPLANYGFTITQNTVVFNNVSTNADSYFWDFGDGQTSTEKSPTHVYAAKGMYTVKMLADNNACEPSERTVTVNIQTVGTEDLEQAGSVRLSPNPTAGDFVLEMNLAAAEAVSIDVFDARGRLLRQFSRSGAAGLNRFSFENLALPSGVYQLKVLAGDSVRVLPLSVH